MKLLTSLILCAVITPSFGQTNGTSSKVEYVVHTNYITAYPDFRRVKGQLYNRRRSILWQQISGEVLRKRHGLIVVRTYREKQRVISGGNLSGLQTIGEDSPGRVATESYKDYGGRIAITNAPKFKNVAVDQNISVIAMKVGTANSEGVTFELWDCGTPNIGRVLTTNKVIMNIKRGKR